MPDSTVFVKSKQRVADHGEVFTPPWMVDAMLDLVKGETERIDSRFLEPACGSGNFLVQILRRKLTAVELKYGKSDFERRHYALLGLMCIYGIELLSDNIAECRANMLEIIAEYLNLAESDEVYRAAAHVLSQNLVHGDALKMRAQDDKLITFAEWGYLGKGKYQRRDFLLGGLAQAASVSTERSCDASKKTLDRGEGMETHAYAFLHTKNIKARVAELFGENMQFDVIIGNPPYQLSDSGFGKSAAPIYQHFVEQAKALSPRYLSMVIPARWFAGGKGLDDFRRSMLTDDRLCSIDDYLSASDVFPGVGLKGGICYFLWDRDNHGACRVTTHFKDWPVSTISRPLLEQGVDVFIRFNEGLSILKKVIAVERGETSTLSLPDSKRFDRLVSSRKPFGLETTFKGKVVQSDEDVLVYQNGGVGYVARSSITTGADLIDKWKLFAGYAAPGTGNKDTYPHRIMSTPFISGPGTISTETYLCFGPFDSENQAESVLSYLVPRKA